MSEPGGERGGEGVRSALFSGPAGLQAGGISQQVRSTNINIQTETESYSHTEVILSMQIR